ncbi:hypothetical protein ANRL2_03116 [Anaerolineae bacterium]|nr:hypothetical protein ANRL2_03116 [Anaerolineae bacterium]
MTKREARVKRYIGDKYLFEVESVPIAKGFVFTITAIDRNTGKRSHVNHLNGILSEFDIDEDDPRYEESSWWVATKEIEKFRVCAGEMLRSKAHLKQIEATLDEDRSLGEWVNTRQEWNPENWIRLYVGA